MSIQTTCPGCQSPFTLAESMVGKKIRCGKCQDVFTVKASNRKRRAEEDDEVEEVVAAEEDEPRAHIRATPPSKGRSAAVTDRRRDDLPVPAFQQPKSNMPWVVGGAVACVALLVVGGITIAMLLRPDAPKSDSPKQVASAPERPAFTATPPSGLGSPPSGITPTVTITPPSTISSSAPPPEPKPAETPVTRPPAPRSDPTRRGELTAEVREEVKRATVLLRVTLPDDTKASGSGFFGAPDSPSIVLTNAHVVGMLSPTSRKPKKVEVVLHSGTRDEKTTSATILGVDRNSDLAVLDVGTSLGMPKPLSVKSGNELEQLDKVFVFGFPLGESLGKEMSIRQASVSSKRLKAGVLEKIQVEGGMSEGNSGGPVVDDTGHVVGVAVSGIPGKNINFAVPGARVESILNGRVMEMQTGQPYKSGDQIGIPVALHMIDPRKKIKEVCVDVWVGNTPHEREPVRPPANSAPAAQAGDTDRKRIPLQFVGGIGKEDVVLPSLPAGKVWWVQGNWETTDGKKFWDFATVYKATSTPVERKAIQLSANYRTPPKGRRLDIDTTTKFRVGPEADTEVATIANKAGMWEQGGANGDGTTLKLTYRNFDQKINVLNRPFNLPFFDLAKPNIKRLIGLIDMDRYGNVRENAVLLDGDPPDEVKTALLFVHQPTRLTLYPTLLGMPGKVVQPKEVWKATRKVAVDTIGSPPREGNIDLTCTYMGVRAVGNREEAVIGIDGVIRDPSMAGRARGLAVLDVQTGTIRKVELEMEVDMPPLEIELEQGKKQSIRVLSAVTMKLERSL